MPAPTTQTECDCEDCQRARQRAMRGAPLLADLLRTEDNSMPAPNMTLFEYSEDPFTHFEWDERNRPNALVFGVELEMESIGGSALAILTALKGNRGNNYILKHDGSLTYGAELVTMPFTLAQHLDGSGIPWEPVLKAARRVAKSAVDTMNCGLHVHINKKALSALTIGKMLVFLNDAGLKELGAHIAQRDNCSYARRSSKVMTDGTRSSESRYDIMNVSVRHPTCEIRMFKGNLTPERVYKNLEFCHALVQYCRESSMRTLTEWGKFAEWMLANRGQYPHLMRFLIETKCVGFRHLFKQIPPDNVMIKDS